MPPKKYTATKIATILLPLSRQPPLYRPLHYPSPTIPPSPIYRTPWVAGGHRGGCRGRRGVAPANIPPPAVPAAPS